MRNLITLLLFSFLASITFAQTQRTVLLEQFTQASCGPCTVSNPWIQNYYNNTSLPLLRIYYHTSWPGTDPMYNHNTAVNGNRRSYYSISSVPSSRIDGTSHTPPGYSGAWGNITMVSRSNVPSPFSLSVTHDLTSDYGSVNVDVTVTAAQDINMSNLKLQAVIVEKIIEYCDPPGSNGEKVFPYVVKDMLPSASGTSLSNSWTNGESDSHSFSWSPSNVFYDSEIAVIVFIQNNTTKEILQSAISETFTPPNVVDAAVKNVYGAEECWTVRTCQDALFHGTIEIQNMGSTPLTSATLNWTMSGIGTGSIPWTGNLGTFETALIDLEPIATPSSVPFTFLNIELENPNGVTDSYTGNNVGGKQVILGSGQSTNQVTVAVTTDAYPNETSWRIRSANGTQVASGGPYGSQNTTQTPVTVNLEDGICYLFEFFDAFGDGICCGFGNGSFSFTDSDGIVLASGADFGSEVVVNFKTEGNAVGIENVILESSFNVNPNPVTDQAEVDFSLIESSNISIHVYDLLGKLIMVENLGELSEGAYTRGLNFSGVSNGVYMVSLMADHDVITEKVVVSR